MNDDLLNVELQDTELIAEIRLVVDLMIASTGSPGYLEQGVIDGLLGIPAASH